MFGTGMNDTSGNLFSNLMLPLLALASASVGITGITVTVYLTPKYPLVSAPLVGLRGRPVLASISSSHCGEPTGRPILSGIMVTGAKTPN